MNIALALIRVGRRRIERLGWRGRLPRIGFAFLEGLGLATFVAAGFAVAAFLGAESPAQVALRGVLLPPNCQAAYFMKSRYLCWFTIADEPFLFIVSLLAMGAGAGLWWLLGRKAR